MRAVAVTTTHIHLLISWSDQTDEKYVCTTLKRLLGLCLSKDVGTTGNRWFSRGRDAKRISDRKHLDHLVNTYLPNHETQGGVFWALDVD